MEMRKNDPTTIRRMFRRVLVAAIILWTAVCAGSLAYHLNDSGHHVGQLARQSALESVEKDLLYRHWAASFGGVYVPVTEQTPPNPYLASYKERDITTPSGKKLTLVSPAYMTRQVYELAKDFTEIQGHITSLRTLRPENAPDPWEARALTAIQAGAKDFGEIVDFNGAQHYRMMYPLFIERSCMKCHASAGYKQGDLRGGISASVPMAKFSALSRDHLVSGAGTFGGIWALGIAGMALSAPFVRRRIREQEQAEAALQHHLKFTQTIIDSEPECVKILDAEGRVKYMNPAGLAMIDAEHIDLVLGHAVHEIVVPEHRDAFVRLNERVFAGESGSLEFEMVGLKGTRRWLATHAVPLRDKDGKVESLLGITRDETTRKQAELELQRSAARYRQLFDGNPHPMWVYDRSSLAFLTVNDAAVNKYGYSRDEFRAMTIADIRPPEDVPRLRETVERRREGILSTGPWRHRKRNGAIIDVEITSHTMTWEGRDAVLVLAHDVTERRQAEFELRNALTLNQTLIDSLPYPSVLIRYSGRTILAANRLARENGAKIGAHCYQGFGMDVEGAQGMDACASCRAEEMFANRETVVTQELFARDRWWTLYWVPVDPATYLHFSIDITERKRLEQQLLQAQKIESVGRLAGGIAHDINNMLTPILGYGELLEHKLPPGDGRRDDLAEIMSASLRVRDMTRQLLAFARKQTLEMVRLDLNEVVSGFTRMLRMTLRENIVIKMQLASMAGSILGDKSQLEQVVMNLAVNAHDAMPSGGTFSLVTQDRVIDAEYAATRPGMTPGTYVQLLALDTGTGMDEETRSKIFDPFFTTKEAGRGTGLGLATAYGIIKQHGGYIEVRSEPGAGTEFVISFPVHEVPADAAKEAAQEQQVQRGTETVLVVEDQEQVLRLVSHMLTGRGYHVLAALSGREAQRVAEAFAGEIHLVVSDVIMPDMNGKELYERLKAARPGLKILYISGYPADVISTQGVLDSGINFLPKPFNVQELAVKVRQVLDSSSRNGGGRRG